MFTLRHGSKTALSGMLLLLAACGGDDSTPPDPPPAPPDTGTEEPYVVLDSVIGVSDDSILICCYLSLPLNESGILLNGRLSADSIQVGDTVLVRGTLTRYQSLPSKAVLDSIDVYEIVAGPVDSVDVRHARMVVMGQRVSAIDSTFVDGVQVGDRSIDTVKAGDRVSVSGYFTASGDVIATRISHGGSPDALVLRGLLRSVDADARRFQVGTVDVDYSQATIDLESFPHGVPEPGEQVVALASARPSGGVLIADQVRPVSRELQAPQGARVNLIAPVTRFDTPGSFDIGGFSVTCPATICLDPDFIRPDAFVAAYATQTSGSVQVDKRFDLLTYHPNDRGSLTGTVTAIDPGTGALTVFGVEAQPSAITLYDDDIGAANFRPIAPADIAVGDTVQIAGGRAGEERTLLASRVSRVSATEGSISATVDFRLEDPVIVMFGREIHTDAQTSVFSCDEPSDMATVFAYADEYYWVVVTLPLVQADPLVATTVNIYTETC